jgi:hypothetical protein
MAALSLGCVLLALTAALGEAQGSSLKPWPLEPTALHAEAGARLREARRDPTAGSACVLGLVGLGDSAIAPLLDILRTRTVPQASGEDAPMLLSEPQAALVLSALEALPRAQVRRKLEELLATQPELAGSRLAGLQLLGEIGTRRDLERLLSLIPLEEDGAPSRQAKSLSISAAARLLLREPDTCVYAAELASQLERGRLRVLIEALSTTRDARARPALLAAAKAQPELASLCVSGFRKLPRAAAPELGMWLAGELPKARPEYARNLCATIAWVDDGDSMAALVEALGHPESAVRDAAQLALREISGLSLPAEPQTWAPWFDEQRHWRETRLPLLAAAIGFGNTREALAALKECAGRRTWKRELAGVLMLGLKRPESGLNGLAAELLTALGAAAVCDQLNPLDFAHQTLRARLCGAAGSAPLRKP